MRIYLDSVVVIYLVGKVIRMLGEASWESESDLRIQAVREQVGESSCSHQI